jgi:hypothetical protein
MDNSVKKETLKVRTNIEGTPVYILSEAKRERIIRIYYREHGSEEDVGHLHKSYLTVRTSKGRTYDIYREAISKNWCINRIYD